MLLRGIHLFAVALVVPPGDAHVTCDHVCAGMHVADHALELRNLAGELMLDRMTRFAFRNVRICCLRAALVSRLLIESRMRRIAIVRIDYVTGRATGRAIVARMIVGAEKVQRRIEQTRLLQTEKNRIGAIVVPKPRGLRPLSGLPGPLLCPEDRLPTGACRRAQTRAARCRVAISPNAGADRGTRAGLLRRSSGVGRR